LKEDFLETYAEQSLVESLSEFLKFAGTKKKKKKKNFFFFLGRSRFEKIEGRKESNLFNWESQVLSARLCTLSSSEFATNVENDTVRRGVWLGRHAV